MLVSMLDMLFDIFEKEPGFQSFHMDSQTLPIQDYLEACPEKEPLVRKYVEEGKLVIGPWFCLPDEFIVGGESLIRNLLLGHKIARRFGPVSKTGYSPFSWGQISQMPQIYQGFGIDVASFYRGINPFVAPKSEWIWEGPDGTQIIASRLAPRPRYNVWYIIQRPVYWNQQDENNRLMSWREDTVRSALSIWKRLKSITSMPTPRSTTFRGERSRAGRAGSARTGCRLDHAAPLLVCRA